MISYDNIPAAPLINHKQLNNRMFFNAGGLFDFKNGSAKTFFLNNAI
jgi:hypothetical protein